MGDDGYQSAAWSREWEWESRCLRWCRSVSMPLSELPMPLLVPGDSRAEKREERRGAPKESLEQPDGCCPTMHIAALAEMVALVAWSWPSRPACQRAPCLPCMRWCWGDRDWCGWVENRGGGWPGPENDWLWLRCPKVDCASRVPRQRMLPLPPTPKTPQNTGYGPTQRPVLAVAAAAGGFQACAASRERN